MMIYVMFKNGNKIGYSFRNVEEAGAFIKTLSGQYWYVTNADSEVMSQANLKGRCVQNVGE